MTGKDVKAREKKCFHLLSYKWKLPNMTFMSLSMSQSFHRPVGGIEEKRKKTHRKLIITTRRKFEKWIGDLILARGVFWLMIEPTLNETCNLVSEKFPFLSSNLDWTRNWIELKSLSLWWNLISVYWCQMLYNQHKCAGIESFAHVKTNHTTCECIWMRRFSGFPGANHFKVNKAKLNVVLRHHLCF